MTVLLVFGGRQIAPGDSPAYAQQALTNICFDRLAGKPTRVIQGGADGYDLCGELWAQAHNIPCDTYPADWRKHGRAAGPIRNQAMIDKGKPNLAVQFPGGRGTADMRKRLDKAGIEVIEVSLP